MTSQLKLNRTHTDCNSSREIPRYIFSFFFLSEKKNFFFLFKFFLVNFLKKFLITPPSLLNYHFHRFYDFLIRKLFSCFFFFFPLFLFYFLFILFSYFLLKSSIIPLLLRNFHFHYAIILPPPQKKERVRSPIFKLNFMYISKFFVCVLVFCF